jgi:tetratricopeptide (TPR) repeat protein
MVFWVQASLLDLLAGMQKITSSLIAFLSVLIFFLDRAGAQNPGVQMDSDIRVFTVLGALHAGGLDDEAPRIQSPGLAIVQELRDTPAALRERIHQFYQDHKETKKSEDQLSKYISLALLSEGPPGFKPVLPLTNLPPDVEPIAEFLDLAKAFYTEAKVEVIWSKYRAYYDQAILRYRPIINQIILTTDGYLRIVSGSFLDRRFTIIPEFLAPPNHFNARNYRENYYLVFGFSEKLKTDEIRHQYLHFILDPFALRFTLPRETRTALTKFLAVAPNIEERYQNDPQFLVTESFIRAAELRMNRVPQEKASSELDASIRSGAVLARHFYEALKTFEASQEGIRLYYPGILKSIDVAQVQTAFEAAQKVPVEKPAEPTEVQKLIGEANFNLGSSNWDKAKELFETVLNSHDASSGDALYGLGVVASIQNEGEKARDFFQKALESPSSDKAVRAWSHIYLGRLHDVEGDRKDALLQYQAAIDIGDNTRDAIEVAKRGMKQPFSSRKSPQ